LIVSPAQNGWIQQIKPHVFGYLPNDPRATAPPHTTALAGSPFRHRAFTVIWIATVVSNIGGWMYNVASGRLMTSLDANALIVSMV